MASCGLCFCRSLKTSIIIIVFSVPPRIRDRKRPHIPLARLGIRERTRTVQGPWRDAPLERGMARGDDWARHYQRAEMQVRPSPAVGLGPPPPGGNLYSCTGESLGASNTNAGFECFGLLPSGSWLLLLTMAPLHLSFGTLTSALCTTRATPIVVHRTDIINARPRRRAWAGRCLRSGLGCSPP